LGDYPDRNQQKPDHQERGDVFLVVQPLTNVFHSRPTFVIAEKLTGPPSNLGRVISV